MRNETRQVLKKYWFRFAIAIVGMIFIFCGDPGEDLRVTLFIRGGFITFCGIALIDSQRIHDLDQRIESLEKKSDESF